MKGGPALTRARRWRVPIGAAIVVAALAGGAGFNLVKATTPQCGSGSGGNGPVGAKCSNLGALIDVQPYDKLSQDPNSPTTVTVTGTGFQASAVVGMELCAAVVTSNNDCDSGTQATTRTDSSGDFTYQFTAALESDSTIHTPNGNIACNESGNCSIGAANFNESSNPADQHASNEDVGFADSDDSLSPASTAIVGTSTYVTLTIPASSPALTIHCKSSTLHFTTPASGLAAMRQTSSPTFTTCSDSSGSDTSKVSGTWYLTFNDASNDEQATEPNTDKLRLSVAKAGLVISTPAGCTVTFAPTTAAFVWGDYNDNDLWQAYDTTVPVSVTGGSGCPTSDTTAEFHGDYTFSPAFHDVS